MIIALCFVARKEVYLRRPDSCSTLKTSKSQTFSNETRHVCSQRPCAFVFPSFEFRYCGQEHGIGVDNSAAEALLGLVRTLPCLPPDQLYAVSVGSSSVELQYMLYLRVISCCDDKEVGDDPEGVLV